MRERGCVVGEGGCVIEREIAFYYYAISGISVGRQGACLESRAY